MATNKLIDNSEDKKYFTLTPQIIWALSRDAYDFTLWSVIKMVAGENGECILSTEDLARLAMMSVGKVSECRKYLLGQKLLEGECRKDPGYPQPVWHLTVPNLWKRNVEWRNSIGDKLSTRIELKRQQRSDSLHQVKPSPGEEGPSPGEEGPSPGEAKKNHEGKPKEEPGGAIASLPPAPACADSRNLTDLPTAEIQIDLLFPQMGQRSHDGIQLIQQADWDIRNPDHLQAMACFLEASRLPIPPKRAERNDWLGSVDGHIKTYGLEILKELYPLIIAQMRGDGLTVSRPGSVTNNLADYWACKNGGPAGVPPRGDPASQGSRPAGVPPRRGPEGREGRGRDKPAARDGPGPPGWIYEKWQSETPDFLK